MNYSRRQRRFSVINNTTVGDAAPPDHLIADLHHYEVNSSIFVCAGVFIFMFMFIVYPLTSLSGGVWYKAAAVWPPPDEIIELIGTHQNYISGRNSRMTSDIVMR